jgi:Ca2+-binding RTX toxin-like protein
VDAAGNTSTASFRVSVRDTTPPVITLLGEPSIVVAAGVPYVDAGATAADSVGGDLTRRIVTVNPVDTGTPGIYLVTYNVSDWAGNAAAEVSRVVRVAHFCGGREATRWGTDGADILMGTAGPDVIVGLGGDDIIFGLGGDDRVCGGAGDDVLFGGVGDDLLWGGVGDDRLAGGKGDDRLGGGAGVDTADYTAAAGPMTVNLLTNLATGEGTDRLWFVENAAGSRRADLLIGGPTGNVLWGNDGDDVLRGGGGGDILWGEAGDDRLLGNGGDDWLWGGLGRNLLIGGLGHDTLDGTPE